MTGKKDGKGLCHREAGCLGKPVREQQLLLHPGARLVLSRLRFRCLHQPASPGDCRFRLRLKLAPGAGLAGSCSAP